MASGEPEQLVRLVRVMFTQDDDGNLVAVNEDDGPPAPKLFVAWSAQGLLWRARHDVPPMLTAQIGAAVAAQPRQVELMRAPACVAELRAVLADAAPLEEANIEYEFPASDAIDATAIEVTADSADVLQRWLPSWRYYATLGLPMTTVLVDGSAVAVCACVRRPDDGATAAGVETHVEFRGYGHAATVTAAWARAVRDRGLVPLYGTSWHNLASQRVAAKLGLRPYAGSISFDSKPR